MVYALLADAVLVLHLLFVLFALLGGLLVWRWHWLAWVHLPAAIWAVLLEFNGWRCPLTPLENLLRRGAGQQGYEGGFVEHQLQALLYPKGLDEALQQQLGLVALVVNLLVYGWVCWRLWRVSRASDR